MSYDLSRVPLQVSQRTTYQDYLDNDARIPPDHVRDMGDPCIASTRIPIGRYVSRDFYEQERIVWDKTWQVACREEHIPNIGDTHVYDIANRSFLIVRTSPDTIRAYPNVCPHRGRKIRTTSACLKKIQCPFHGFAWNLDGSTAHIPSSSEFPTSARTQLALKPVRTATFAGWVFINPDSEAAALHDYLDPAPDHFEGYLWHQSFLALHVGKVFRANWKVVQEAFMESFHALATHPQAMAIMDDLGCQYDQWNGKPHVSRMLVPFAVASAYVREQTSEQMTLHGMANGESLSLENGEKARRVIAEARRAALSMMTGADLADTSDAELVDGWYYSFFPNFMLWNGYGPNLWYRFRPWRDEHEQTLMEVGLLLRHPADAPKPSPPPMTLLSADQSWSDAPGFQDLAGVLDQDTSNISALQEGLRAAQIRHITLASYQESRIAQFHQTLDSYCAPLKKRRRKRSAMSL